MKNNQIEIISADQREVELLEKNRKINLQKLFTPEGMDLIIAEIEKETADFEADINTKQGQAAIKSMAAKVAKCKAPIKNLAMELKEDSRKFIEGVNQEWNRYEKAMDTLRDKIRKPVDDIEEREAKELEERQNQLRKIENFKTAIYTSDEAPKLYEESIKTVKQLLQFNWGDFVFKAETVANDAIKYLEEMLVAAKKYQDDQAELAELKKEKEERDKKDREDKIASEAAAKAKEAADNEKKELEQKAKKEKLRSRIETLELLGLVFERGVFVFRNILIEISKVENFEDHLWKELLSEVSNKVAKIKEFEAAENTRKAVEASTKKALEDAAEAERKENEATEKREKNKRHRAKIENQAFVALSKIFEREAVVIGDSSIQEIISAISKGEVPNVQINY